jgi:hypothetical protein
MPDSTRSPDATSALIASPIAAVAPPVLRALVPAHLLPSLGLDPGVLAPARGAPEDTATPSYALADTVQALAVRMAASEDAVVSRAQAAAWLGRSPKTLEAWASVGLGPRVVRMGRRGIGYRVGELRRWVRQQERAPLPGSEGDRA